MTKWQDTYYEEELPPGATRDYDSPNLRGVAFIIVCLLCFIISTSFGGVRIYTKVSITRAMGWDDYTCICTMLGNVIWTVTNISMACFGMGRDDWNARNTYRSWGFYTHNAFVANLSYFITIMFVKMSILFLYRRTFIEGRLFRYMVDAVLFVLVTSHVAFLCTLIFALSPPSCAWRQFETDEDYYASCSRPFSLVVLLRLIVWISSLTVVLDMIIISLPCRAVWRLHLPKRQKLVILITLMAGILVTLASILRLVYLADRFFYTQNSTFTEWRVNLISTIEINVALVCICLPVLKAFTRRFFPSLLKLWSSAGAGYGGSQSAKRSKSHQLSSHHAVRGGRKRNADSHEDDLVSNAAYLELGEDGKSDRDQHIAMSPIEVKTAINVESRPA